MHSTRRHSLIVGLFLIALAVLMTISGLHLLSDRAAAEVVTWDKSSIVLTGQCLLDGRAEFTIRNTGADMAGSSAWREYEADVLAQSGAFQLDAGVSQVWTFGPLPNVPIRFEADQRPGHPGSSAPRLTLTCSRPTAVSLRTFTATSAGNRGGCAPANQWPRLSCVVSDFRPGFVSGTCEAGLWFRNAPTRRSFRLAQAITVWGCEGLDYELFSAPGYPLRIAR